MIQIISAESYNSGEHFDCEVTPHRRVKCYELELYNGGTGTTHINGVALPHKKNRFVCAKPGQVRFSHGTFECEAIHFLCSDYETCKILNSFSDFVDTDADTAESIRATMAKLYGDCSDFLVGASAVFGILSQVFAGKGGNSKNGDTEKYHANVVAAREYIDKNYSAQIRLSDIAKEAFLSPNFLRVEFERIIGISPHSYLLSVRLEKACRLLQTTSLSLVDIALECGFRSQSYMNYVFKKSLNMTPGEYRQKQK